MNQGYRKTYWLAQSLGWMLYAFLSLFASYVDGRLHILSALVVLLAVLSGIILTHLLRELIVRYWQGNKFFPSSGKWIILFVPVLAMVQVGVQMLLQVLFIPEFTMDDLHWLPVFYAWVNWVVILYVWLALYMLYRYIELGRQAEIQELQLQSLQHEIELSQLRSQLNPHFLFNAMNSIRALVNENPDMAREAITRLSEMLRSTFVSGRKNTVSIAEEMALVSDYLALEKLRFEERLNTGIEMDADCQGMQIPPFVIQTLVENALKHGIARIPAGGHISVRAHCERGNVEITVRNTGSLTQKNAEATGIGWENTRKRLSLIFGDRALFKVYDENNEVICYIRIPALKL